LVYFLNMIFKDRKEAGKLLAKKIPREYKRKAFVFGLPRGGVAVAAEIAKALSVPFDVIVCRKLGSFHNPELAFGALAPNDTEYIDWEMAERIGISPYEIGVVVKKETIELKRRNVLYRQGKKYPDLSDKNVFIVDDGIATGATIMAAIEFVKTLNPKKIIISTPACTHDTAEKLHEVADELITLIETDNFYAVGQFYQNFPQVTDTEVLEILGKDSKNPK